MENWKNEIEDFLSSKGISKTIIEFTEQQEYAIKNFINDIGKNAFDQLKDELNLYTPFNVNVTTSKSKRDSVYENIGLNIVRNNQILFSYKPTFLNDNGVIKVIFKFSIPDLYNETKSLSDSNLNQAIDKISVQSILDDFSACFKNNFRVK